MKFPNLQKNDGSLGNICSIECLEEEEFLFINVFEVSLFFHVTDISSFFQEVCLGL